MQSGLKNKPAKQLLSQIKKKPFTQNMKGTNYIYSVLPKKQSSFIFTNDRFVCIKGIQSISYSNALPLEGKVPFKSASQLPKPKVTISLHELQVCFSDQELFVLEFSNKNKDRWEFICLSASCATDWRNKVEAAVGQLQKYKLASIDRIGDSIMKSSFMKEARKEVKKKEERKEERREEKKEEKRGKRVGTIYQTPREESTMTDCSRIHTFQYQTVNMMIKPQQKKEKQVLLTLSQSCSLKILPTRLDAKQQQEDAISPNSIKVKALLL